MIAPFSNLTGVFRSYKGPFIFYGAKVGGGEWDPGECHSRVILLNNAPSRSQMTESEFQE